MKPTIQTSNKMYIFLFVSSNEEQITIYKRIMSKMLRTHEICLVH